MIDELFKFTAKEGLLGVLLVIALIAIGIMWNHIIKITKSHTEELSASNKIAVEAMEGHIADLQNRDKVNTETLRALEKNSNVELELVRKLSDGK